MKKLIIGILLLGILILGCTTYQFSHTEVVKHNNSLTEALATCNSNCEIAYDTWFNKTKAETGGSEVHSGITLTPTISECTNTECFCNCIGGQPT
jgi:hypothetical protein